MADDLDDLDALLEEPYKNKVGIFYSIKMILKTIATEKIGKDTVCIHSQMNWIRSEIKE